MHDQNLVDQAKIFIRLQNQLLSKGYRKKDIAGHLHLFPSAFSSLVNQVLKKLALLSPPVEKKEVTRIFASVNNVSEIKVRRNLKSYLEKLQSLLEENNTNQFTEQTSPHLFFDDLLQQNPEFLWTQLEGIYDCYYLSSFGYKMKCEPFMMKKTGQNLTVFKGNAQSPAQYQGIAYLSNHQLLTIHLQEKDAVSKDHFIIHFQLPPSYHQTLQMLRGISLSMANSFQPLARKIVVKKQRTKANFKAYQDRPTRFFNQSEAQENPILNYLRHSPHILELLSIPHPSYQEKDLEHERKMLEFLSQ